ncbi:interleukin-10 receptor subunit beta-like [Leptodactylus fuscus]|uniref:interleukin-10 receptor subunit beta-like isoform X1 n=1 Tax=Leptodactylus fuscus TaxID=238119 RepID=UPI003F4F27FE
MDYYYGLLIFICCWIPGSGAPPAPINVTMDSFNFRNTLRWSRPADLTGDVTYTVQYRMDVSSTTYHYKTICITREQRCEASSITYRSYVRVSSQQNGTESDWVTLLFDPNIQTIIGPPEVSVSSRSGYLDVSFVGPFVGFDKGSLKEKYGEFIYKVLYWKESEPAHVLVVNTSQNTEILHGLETWTVYCVKVQAYVSDYDKAGEFSSVICEKTTEDGRIPSWKIAVLFIGSMALAAIFILLLIFLTYKAYKMIRYIFFPSYSLPQHLKEYLSRPFYSTPFLHPQPTEEFGESCEQLTSISIESEEQDAA